MTISSDNFVFVYVDGVSDSREVAEYYANSHEMNIINRDTSINTSGTTSEGIYWEINGQIIGIRCDSLLEVLEDEDSFNKNVLNPLIEALGSDEFEDRSIQGIILGYRVPGGFKYYPESSNSLSYNIISSTSRVSRLYHPFEPKVANKFYKRVIFSRYSEDDSNFALICSRIDAPSVFLAKEYINNAITLTKQLFVSGMAYIDPYGGSIDDGYLAYQREVEEVRDFISRRLNLEIFTTYFRGSTYDPSIPFVENDSFVWSWGKPYVSGDFFQFSSFPRVFFYNADNDGGTTIRDEKFPTFPVYAMKAGYCSCASSMSNPTIEGFLSSYYFFGALFKGATIGEAYLFSLPYFDWTVTLFGDPLPIVSFPLTLEEEEKEDVNSAWLSSTKELAREVAYLKKKEKELLSALEVVMAINNVPIELELLPISNKLYLENNTERINSVMYSSIAYAFEYPIRLYSNSVTTRYSYLDDYLSDKNYKISKLLSNVCPLTKITNNNLYEEGWWEFEYNLQDDYFGFIDYHFQLEVYSDEEMTGLLIKVDSISGTGWTYEKEKSVFTSIPSNGVSSSFVGRRIRYESQKDDLLNISEYLIRSQVYYFRIRQYSIVEDTYFEWRNYEDIIYS